MNTLYAIYREGREGLLRIQTFGDSKNQPAPYLTILSDKEVQLILDFNVAPRV